MNKALLPLILFMIFAVLWFSPLGESPSPTSIFPEPTEIHEGEESEKHQMREAWMASLHRAAEGVDWKQVEYLTQMTKNRQRANSGLARSGCDLLEIAGGQLKGTWQERGSINQAGSVFDTEYDPVTDEVWVISAGGTLFKGDRLGQNWEVINQDFKFSHGLLKFVPLPDGGRRLLAGINRVPHYSDDDGVTWTPASGLEVTNGWGNFHSSVVLDNASNTIYLLFKPSYWSSIQLYKSEDQGESFTSLQVFPNNFFSNFMLCNPHGTNDVFLVRKLDNDTGYIYEVNTATDQLTLMNEDIPLFFGDIRANLIGVQTPNGTRFYAYTSTLGVVQSEDISQGWDLQGYLPTEPWSVGMYVLPSDPDALFYGDIELYRSLDAGNTWEMVNNWWEYYDFVETKIHADIMHMAEFEMTDGTPFFLVSNHGGLQYSSDKMTNQLNIGLSGLNVSQYYSVRTDPLNPNYVYAGSQDQGFQRSVVFEQGGIDDIEPFEQVISGDYGHIVFTNSGQALWTVYPGGWVIHYNQPRSAYHVASYDLESQDESVWLPPLMSSPDASEDAIYMAGGNINGGEGSYLVRLEMGPGGISATQGDFNFLAESGGELSALESSPLNSDIFYAATTSGRFFYSNDAGDTWEQTAIFLPGGHYLYGQTILASSIDENTVYLGGSGYSNPPAYRSTDGGETFVSISEGLPSTLIFELTANADESMLFAATEAGPYVYVAADEQWYDMSGVCAPTHTYWTVEYVESINTVRFGTYGRGIWDFVLEEEVSTSVPIASNQQLELFPNPSTGPIRVRLSNAEQSLIEVQIYAMDGQLLNQWQYQTIPGQPFQQEIPTVDLAAGNYTVVVQDGKRRQAKVIVIQ